MERDQKNKIAVFAFFGLVFALLGISKPFSADKTSLIEKGKVATSQEGQSAGVCTLETIDNGKTFFVSCSGFLE